MNKLTTLILTALLLAALSTARAADAAKPILFAAYYCWYHSPTNSQEPWLHWTYPASASNAVAKKEQRDGDDDCRTVLVVVRSILLFEDTGRMERRFVHPATVTIESKMKDHCRSPVNFQWLENWSSGTSNKWN